jgi:prepilin-type N-terminal cleavage/methylation domain-containing protein
VSAVAGDTPPVEAGFSLVELLVAMAITLAVTASVFAVLDPANGAFQTQPEAADVEQRTRVVSDALERELLAAGAGAPHLGVAGQLARLGPAILPYRVGLRAPDVPGSFHAGRITTLRFERAAAQSTLTAPLAAASGSTQIALGGACPPADPSCGFRADTNVMVLDETGAWDLYSVVSVTGAALTLRHNTPDGPKVYQPGSVIAAASSRTFMLGTDAGGTPQFLRYEGASGFDVPVASHVVALQFTYLGDAEPPSMIGGVPGMGDLRTTYGPPPPAPGDQPTTYPPGENCAFARDGAGAPVSRLPVLAAGPVLVPLPESALTDGPWCPDPASPNRYDADLLRVRRVVVYARVESAIASLRGPAGPLFSRGGTAAGTRFVADRELSLTIAPRALNQRR